MVPTLGIGKQSLISNNFVNAFSGDKDKDIDYENAVFLLFKPKNLNVFKEFLEEEYERTKDIVEDYDYVGGYVVVVYQLNPNFKKDFDLIRKGSYSKTSETFQKLFPKSIAKKAENGGVKESIQVLIFRKDKQLISFWEDLIGTENLADFSLEVWPMYDPQRETLNIKQIVDDDNKTSIK